MPLILVEKKWYIGNRTPLVAENFQDILKILQWIGCLFPKAQNGTKPIVRSFFAIKKTKKVSPDSKKDGACNRPLPAPTELIAKRLLEKPTFCT